MEYGKIPQKIRELRNKKKLSIQELAKRAELTPGYLSKIENSDSPPPIPTLSKIAYALNVHISYFFDEERPENGLSIVRENERKEIVGDLTPSGYNYHAVIHKRFDDGSFNPFVLTLPSEVIPETIPYNSHQGEELIYVLEGELIFCYGDDEYPVSEGDCLYFNAIVPHRVIRTTQKGKAEILSILFLHNVVK
jgi:transcriptional regulator with XRE-family HTH domain